MTSVFFGLALSEEIIYLYNDINKSNNSYIDPESDYAKKNIDTKLGNLILDHTQVEK